MKYVYFAEFSKYIKIGRSVRPSIRISSLRHGQACPSDVNLKDARMLGVVKETDNRTERTFHGRLKAHRVAGCREWFHDSQALRDSLPRLSAAPECKADFFVAIPNALHKRVKTAAARKGVSMRIFIAAALAECLKPSAASK